MKKSLIALCFLLLAVGALAQGTNPFWTFDNDKPGQIAAGFSSDSGVWKVLADAVAPSAPNVFAQLGKSSSSSFNIALLKDPQFKEVDISVQMKAVAGRTDRGGGLVWRAVDTKNYYIVRYNPLEDNFRLYKVVKGARSNPLQDVSIRHTDGWHEIRVTMTGDLIECYYDKKKYMSVRDTTFREAGKIGLWTKADAQTYFDNLAVSNISN